MDFIRLNQALLASARELLPRWFPNGKWQGPEFCVGNLAGDPGKSLRFNIVKGHGADFETGETFGDMTDLYAKKTGRRMIEAARELEGDMGLSCTIAPGFIPPARPNGTNGHSKPARKVEMPIPIEAPSHPKSFDHPAHGPASQVWDYLDEDGKILGYVARYDLKHGKTYAPWTYADGEGWGLGSWPDPKPLYGLYGLYALKEIPEHPILICEGEKDADAARTMSEGRFICLTWPHGAKSWGKADWTPVIEAIKSPIFYWPDNDAAGKEAMEGLRGMIGRGKILEIPADKPEGWGAADALAEGWDTSKLALFIEPDAATDWGTPTDLWEDEPLPPLELDMLPEGLRAYVNEVSELTGSDPVIAAVSALVICAGMIDDQVRVQLPRFDKTWTEHACLWGAVVGQPSVKKSPVLKKLMAPVKAMDADLIRQNKTEQDEYKRQLARFEKDNARGPANAGEPIRPPKRRLLIENATTEAASDIAADNPRGLLCHMDELSGWFGMMDAYNATGRSSGKDRAAWLDAYNGGIRVIDRVSRGNILVPNWSICVLGGIQPDELKRIRSRLTDDGLLQRFMIVLPRNGQKGVDREPDWDVQGGWRELLERLSQMRCAYGQDKNGHWPASYVLDEAAHDLWSEYADWIGEHVEAASGMSKMLGSWMGKLAGLMGRLALVYHCIDKPENPAVDVYTMARVVKFVKGLLMHHAGRFYVGGEAINEPGNVLQHARWIAGHIIAHKSESITLRDIETYYGRTWKRMPDKDRADIMRMLEVDSWLLPKLRKRDLRQGDEPRAWVVNPKVHELFAGRKERENKSRSHGHELAASIGRRAKEQNGA